MKMNLSKWLFGLLVAAIPTLGIAQSCLNPFSWLWWSNLAYDTDNTLGPGSYPVTYAYSIQQAAPTYLNTDLDYGVGPNGEGEVNFYNGYLGAGIVYAYARTWSGTQECTSWNGVGTVDGYFCNGSTLRADSGWVVYNDYWTASLSIGALERVTAHEVGHVFGLGHVPSSCLSVMYNDPINFGISNLSTFEINFINFNY